MILSGTMCRSASRVAYLVAASCFLAGTGYAAWYLSRKYDNLVVFYMQRDAFYRDAQWTTDFFTPTVKHAGNAFATIGIVVGLISLAYLYRSWRKRERRGFATSRFSVPRVDVAVISSIAMIQGALWWYGNGLLPPSFDEIFSALNAAGEGVFRSLSYYMLPNNHLLFNALNAAAFGSMGDLLLTGRIISLVSFIALGAIQFFWLKGVIKNRWLAGAVIVLLSVLLPVWGFAVQARGYLLLLLASWLAFVGLWHYLGSGKARWRGLFAVGSVMAYATVPVFLYVHVAMLCWVLTDWIKERRIDYQLLISQLIAGAAVLMFYLPALTFSGFQSITANRYVAAGTEEYGAFAARFLPTLPDYANYSTQELAEVFPWLMSLLFLLPVVAWWRSRVKGYRRLACFQLLLISCTVVTVLLMRAVPFHRTIIFQLQFGGMVVALFLIWGIVALGRRLRVKGTPIAAATVLLSALYLALDTPQKFSLHLYYYDIVPTYTAVAELVSQVPTTARVAFSDEGFYARYLGKNREITVVEDPAVAEFYMKERREPLPEGNFELVGSAADIELYRRVGLVYPSDGLLLLRTQKDPSDGGTLPLGEQKNPSDGGMMPLGEQKDPSDGG
ncbi:hypothetical protein GGR28_001732 [Lewinella aquimaris]|uniref:Glycosyltransferase RgtA/B/C/D-like domain-containing protein n=1 Tax=Neolewinella aquimaris TaxID=1835722 RepID=A0A840E668_9BACT|nr:hypothetical protein [Neolewinella aquimaris]MBB4079115.1 hypothetical protein [Neolewinella aquimaris]